MSGRNVYVYVEQEVSKEQLVRADLDSILHQEEAGMEGIVLRRAASRCIILRSDERERRIFCITPFPPTCPEMPVLHVKTSYRSERKKISFGKIQGSKTS
jgi:hypothetical protein